MTNKVLVYGTLKKGGRFHFTLEKETFLGERDVAGYVMYDLGSFPGIIEGDGTIKCEMYSVCDDTLKVLDSIEGYHENDPQYSFYMREVEDDAFIYVFNRNLQGCDAIESGEWVNE